jgi:hypothetical protein
MVNGRWRGETPFSSALALFFMVPRAQRTGRHHEHVLRATFSDRSEATPHHPSRTGPRQAGILARGVADPAVPPLADEDVRRVERE